MAFNSYVNIIKPPAKLIQLRRGLYFAILETYAINIFIYAISFVFMMHSKV